MQTSFQREGAKNAKFAKEKKGLGDLCVLCAFAMNLLEKKHV